jgi:hypothetical protein
MPISPLERPAELVIAPIVLPPVTVLAKSDHALITREALLREKKLRCTWREDELRESRDKTLSQAVRSEHYKAAQALADDAQVLEERLSRQFVPTHGSCQFISPRAFFASPLFRVGAYQEALERDVELELGGDSQGKPIRYSGPELRQGEGLVFLALLNMLRDVPAGSVVTFAPKALCIALFGHYDGRSRGRLRDRIRRLQKGQIRAADYTVQLCLRFEHPSTGGWAVSLDRDIVCLFERTYIWLDVPTRLALPEGLATWLYGYVRAQTRLIPTAIMTLKALCGSHASERAFTNSLRDALLHLKTHKLIDAGYQLKNGQVRWRKPLNQV